MIVFSKEKYIEVEGQADYRRNKEWVDKCDGLTVTKCNQMGLIIDASWVAEDENQEILKESASNGKVGLDQS